MIDKVVEPRPDLVVVAFGMNDAAGRSAQEYQANIEGVVARVRERLPDAEFILVASMLGNRGWTRLRHELFPEYRDALAETPRARRRPGRSDVGLDRVSWSSSRTGTRPETA